MKVALAALLLLSATACRQDDAPADKIEETAEQLIEPEARPTVLAPGRYAPHDDCANIPGAAAFRAQLARAVETRDAAALAGLAASDIKLDFGGGAGVAELQRRLSDPEQDLWAQLAAILPLGCAADENGGVMIPWIAAQEFDDPFSTVLVMGEDVPVRSAAAADAPEIGRITWDVVGIRSMDREAAFQQVQLPGDRTGFIATESLRSPVDYRLMASSRNGKWSITTFVRGD
jgi:hypothetical protein